MIMYYETINTTTHKKEIWKGDNTKASWLLSLSTLIRPLGTSRPSNIKKEDVRTF